MFSRQDNSNATRVLARALLTVFIGTFLLASHPRIPGIVAHAQPDSESRYRNLSDFLDVTIVGRGLKNDDFQSPSRLFAALVSHSDSHQKVVRRGADRSVVYSDAPAAGSFLIRSPPSVPTL